jgi:hypothetical protein
MEPDDSDSIYEKAPNKPNFFLILVLSGVAIICLFIGAYVFLRVEGTKLMPHPHKKADPNAELTTPTQMSAPAVRNS